MPRLNLETAFARTMTRILAERRELQRAIAKHRTRLAEIDAMFVQAGLTPPADVAMPAPGLRGAAKPQAKPAATTTARPAPLHSRQLSQAQAAALAKGREARWAEFRAAKAVAPQTKAAIAKQPRRKTYKQTSEQFILALLAGGKSLTTAQINQAWKDGGRQGLPKNTLSLMTQAKKLQRQPEKDGRGSVYRVA